MPSDSQTNLLDEQLAAVDSHELRLLLDERIGRPGQYDGRAKNKLYLPLARDACRVALTFTGDQITRIEPGPAFDASQWQQIRQELTTSVLSGRTRVGRDYSFCTLRVQGWWRGARSRVQLLSPPESAPDTHIEIADHPFVLEFPIREASLWSITNDRRLRQHRNLTLLLNALLAGRTSCLPRRQDHFWAYFPNGSGDGEFKWAQNFYFAKLGKALTSRLSNPKGQPLREIDAERYYGQVGHDGQGLRVPSDLDEMICLYFKLSAVNQAKFDRATFWIDIASRVWNTSLSASFAARVAAIESLTTRGIAHSVYCPDCDKTVRHEVPGPTALFKDFFETYAPGAAQQKRRDLMYTVRSTIVHGGGLMQMDVGRALGWDPPGWDELELSRELSALTRIALRNWLKAPNT